MNSKEAEMTWEDYCWIAEAVGYDNVSTIGAAYKKLLEFREILSASGSLLIHGKEKKLVNSVEEYDEWVRNIFPVFVDDPLHPLFKGP